MKLTDKEDKDAVVVISSCKKCKGVAVTAFKHWMNKIKKKEFNDYVNKHDLNVKEMPLLDFRKENREWCKC